MKELERETKEAGSEAFGEQSNEIIHVCENGLMNQ